MKKSSTLLTKSGKVSPKQESPGRRAHERSTRKLSTSSHGLGSGDEKTFRGPDALAQDCPSEGGDIIDPKFEPKTPLDMATKEGIDLGIELEKSEKTENKDEEIEKSEIEVKYGDQNIEIDPVHLGKPEDEELKEAGADPKEPLPSTTDQLGLG